MTEEEQIRRLPNNKQRRMAMLALAGVKFTLKAGWWHASWGAGCSRASWDLSDLLGYTYTTKTS